MIQKQFVLNNPTGLHARPASIFVITASSFESDILLVKDGIPYNGKSILGILAMGAGMGTTLVLEVDGVDEAAAAEALLRVLENMI